MGTAANDRPVRKGGVGVGGAWIRRLCAVEDGRVSTPLPSWTVLRTVWTVGPRFGRSVSSFLSFFRGLGLGSEPGFLSFGKGNVIGFNGSQKGSMGGKDVVGPSRDEKTQFATTNHEHGHLHGTGAWCIARVGSVGREGEVEANQGTKYGWRIPREGGGKKTRGTNPT